MHNDVLLIFKAILLTHEPQRERRGVKMGQQKADEPGHKD